MAIAVIPDMCMHACVFYGYGKIFKQAIASNSKQASGKERERRARRPRSRIVESATVGPRNAMEALGGWQVGQELRQKQGLGQPSVGGCMAVVWLCTDDIPYGGIMS